MIKPRAQVTRRSTPQPGYLQLSEPQVQIAAWCPDDEANLPPEQVHFVFNVQELSVPLVLRFKSPDTLGFFIEELIKYRRTVWPDCEPAEGEAITEWACECGWTNEVIPQQCAGCNKSRK